MKKIAIAVLFFMLIFISKDSVASDIFGYWKSDEKPPFNIVFISDEKFYSGKQKFNILRLTQDKDEYIIFIVKETYKMTEKDKKEIESLSDNEMRMRMITHILVKKDGDNIIISTMTGKKIKYSRITKDIYNSLSN